MAWNLKWVHMHIYRIHKFGVINWINRVDWGLSAVILDWLVFILLAEPFFGLIDFTKKTLSRVRSLLRMHSMLFGNSLKPRPNGCALVTAGLGMTIALSINGFLHFEREKDLLLQTSRLWQPQRFDVIRQSLKDKRRLCLLQGALSSVSPKMGAQVLV